MKKIYISKEDITNNRGRRYRAFKKQGIVTIGNSHINAITEAHELTGSNRNRRTRNYESLSLVILPHIGFKNTPYLTYITILKL